MAAGDDELYNAMLSTVRELSQSLVNVREEIKEDTAQLLRSYREDVHRAIMGIHIRIVSLEDTIETDRGARIARQQTLDGELRGIRNNQRLWIRAVVFVVLVALGIGIGVWLW